MLDKVSDIFHKKTNFEIWKVLLLCSCNTVLLKIERAPQFVPSVHLGDEMQIAKYLALLASENSSNISLGFVFALEFVFQTSMKSRINV